MCLWGLIILFSCMICTEVSGNCYHRTIQTKPMYPEAGKWFCPMQDVSQKGCSHLTSEWLK